MTRTATRCRYAAVALLIASWAPIAASAAVQQTPAACPLEVVGTWRLATATESEPGLLSFSPDGWLNVLSGSAEGHARDFARDLDIVAQVRYELVPRREPKRIQFRTQRGNDVFPAGASSWEITAYTDESFTVRRADAEAGEQSLWSRVQTHRYFLTFAARNGITREGAATGDAAAFVMWTTLDGNKTGLEALGTREQGSSARFGRIPNELAKAFATQSDRGDDVMMRLELSEAEYRRSHAVFAAWDALLSGDRLARDDPQGQAMELLEATVQSVNRCGVRIQLADANSTAATDSSKKANLLRRPLEFVRLIRRSNDRRHVPDKAFPFRWKPPSVT
jgi:hypothetical protein